MMLDCVIHALRYETCRYDVTILCFFGALFAFEIYISQSFLEGIDEAS
jgi:hypothetical protein